MKKTLLLFLWIILASVYSFATEQTIDTLSELKKSQDILKGVVEKTARKFGFYHMGQFAKSYKEFFGELPSQTLKTQLI